VSPVVAGITGGGREWTVWMISVYPDIRIDRVIRTSALSEPTCAARWWCGSRGVCCRD